MKQLLLFKPGLGVGLALLFLSASMGANAETRTWEGGNGMAMDWTLGTNWSDDMAPVAGDDVVFNTAGIITFSTMPTSVSYNSLTIYQGTVTLTALATRTLTLGGNASTDFTIANGASLALGKNVDITLASNATADISGTLTVNKGCAYDTDGASVVTTVAGSIINEETVTSTTTSNLLFNSGSTYEHARDGGIVPTATWDAASNCNLTGLNGAYPSSGMGQTFGNVAFDLDASSGTEISGNLYCAGNLRLANADIGALTLTAGATNRTITVGGNLTHTTGEFRQSDGTGTGNITVQGDFIKSGSGQYIIVSEGTNSSLTVVGDVNISDGIVNLSDNTGTGTLYVAGNFSHTGGTITETVTGRGEIIFNGSAQNYTGGGTISNTIDFTINSGSTLTGTGTIGSSSGTPGTTTNHGTIAPGNSIGTLNVNGPFTTDGTIAMEIAGAPSAANDVLAVNGTVMLGGTLTVTQMGGTITNGDNYDVITGTSISGTFATLNLPGVLTDWMATYTTSLNLAYMGTNPLPIELVYFKGTPMGKAIELTWRTATEQNNDYMAVERSADGAKFTELGRIKGAGTTEEPQEYAFVDEHPLRGLNYYRLRQVDFDGVFAYHKTIGVLFGGKDSGLGVQAWPNPAQGQLQVGWGRNANTPTMLQLLDMTGRKLAEYEVAAGANTFDLPLHGLPAGLYFLKARQGQEEEMVRFWRQ